MAAGTYAPHWLEAGIAARRSPRREAPRGWKALCVAALLPYTAILHHAVFYHQECMLNSFGADYTPAVVLQWLSRDPSLMTAIGLAMLTYRVGLRWPALRQLLPPLLLACLPLSLWVWDVPFSGRVICHTLHDLRPLLPGGVPLRGAHFYAFAGAGYPALLLLGRHFSRRSKRVRAEDGARGWPLADETV